MAILILPLYSIGQNKNVGFGTPTPHPSAIVHIGDNQAKGFKIPYTDTNAVYAYANSYTPPIPIANGLLIYQKGAEAFYYYSAPLNKWVPLSGITGPTGPKGPTGPTGVTGRTGFASKVRWGNGPPVQQPSDTTYHYYIDMDEGNIYRFNPWGWSSIPVGGSYKNRIVGGETFHISSLTNQDAAFPSSGTAMNPINNLVHTVVAPPGFEAFAWIHAYGAVRKNQINDEFNYAKFDIYIGSPAVPSSVWQVVSMGPTGPAPEFHQELVSWSISLAVDLGSGKRIEVYGGQQKKTKSALGTVRLAGAPGTPEEAHLDIMVIYVRNI